MPSVHRTNELKLLLEISRSQSTIGCITLCYVCKKKRAKEWPEALDPGLCTREHASCSFRLKQRLWNSNVHL